MHAMLLVLVHRGSVDQTLGTESSVLANRRVMKNEGMEHSEVKSLGEDQFRDTLREKINSPNRLER